jgi:hypothetical protein
MCMVCEIIIKGFFRPDIKVNELLYLIEKKISSFFLVLVPFQDHFLTISRPFPDRYLTGNGQEMVRKWSGNGQVTVR